MLRLTNIKPNYFIEDIDESFDTLSVSDCYPIIKAIVNLNSCLMITAEKDIDAITKIVDLRMRHKLFGSLSLANLPTGLKALCIAMISKKHKVPF